MRMPKKSLLLRSIIFITATVVTIIVFLTQPTGLPDYWAEILLSTSITIWLAHNAIRYEQFQATLIHALTLTLGLSLGIGPALLALTAGLTAYLLIDLFQDQHPTTAGFLHNNDFPLWFGIWAQQVIANSLGLSLYFWLGGSLVAGSSILPSFWPFLGCIIGFSFTFLFLHWIQPSGPEKHKFNRRETYGIITITLAPAPVILLASTAFGFLGTAGFIIYSIILAVSAPIFRSLTRMEKALRQRAEALEQLSELATSITSSYDPDQIMDMIVHSSISIGCGDQALIYVNQSPAGQEPHSRSLKLSQTVEAAWLSHITKVLLSQDQIGKDKPLFYDRISDQTLPRELYTVLQSEGIISLASLPLQTSQTRLGRLTIFSGDPVNFSPRRRELLTLFASQAAFTLSNAQTHASADQFLSLQSEQLARLEEINRQLTASSVTENLHEVILDHAIQATSAEWGYLAIYDPETERLTFTAYQGRENATEIVGDEPQFSIDDGLFGQAFRTGQILNIQNTTADLTFANPLGTDALSVLCVPVCGPEAMLGVIGVESSETQAFRRAHEQFLIQLSAYAANALYHARIYHELQDRLTEQSLLYQASTQIAESLESDAVGQAIADSLRVTVQSNIASVYRWDNEEQSLTLLARIADGRPSIKHDHTVPDIHQLLGHAQCIKDRVSMQWSSNEEVGEQERAYLLGQYGEGRLLLLPLCIGERTLGIVEIYRKDPAPFSNNAIRSAQSIAIQATIALENTDLFQRISESHNRLLAVLNSTREGILLINTVGNIAIVNNQIESMIGLKPEDLLQASLDDNDLNLAARLGYHQTELTELATSLKNGQAQLAGSATFNTSEGAGRTYHRIDAPVYDSTDQLIGWLISIRDISEEHEIEETRDQLTEMIVHDLRSPLTAILNSLALLQREVGGQLPSSLAEQAFAVSDRSVNQMLGLVNSLLDISRLESGKLKISPERIPIAPMVVELQERFQLEANAIGIILKTNYGDANLSGFLDQEKIQRVLANLLDNALKFTPEGGEVELGFSLEKSEIIFWVSDTGPGIPPEFHQKIFERYIQIPGSTGRRRGTGLGLAFAKLAVEAHQGHVWVEDHPSGGSIFKFSLPAPS